MAEVPPVDVVVVGASAGGIEALERVMAGLTSGFPAAVAVVVHVPSNGLSALPQILSRAGPLDAHHARHGEPLRPGRVHVAPPDRHLLLVDGRLSLSRGPRENGHRPSVDALFRSAARSFGPRVAGVVLSGALDDGSAGLAAIKGAGGVAVVQDPADATYPDMPRHALDRVEADHVVPARGVGAVLAAVTNQDRKVDRLPTPGPNGHKGTNPAAAGTELPPGTTYGCPDCGGVLEPDAGQGVVRCRVGHAWAPQSLLAAQSDRLEEALWVALRTLEERVELAGALAAAARQRNHALSAERFEEAVARSETLAQTVREILEAGAEPVVEPRRQAEAG